jgi:hypothetical protein
MDLMRYVDTLRQELLLAAEVGDDETRELAGRLMVPLSSAVRLVLLEVLSATADEISRDLAPGSVEIRLRGLEPTFVVTPPPTDQDPGGKPSEDYAGAPGPTLFAATPSAGREEGTLSRINFRPPEQLKAAIEQAAGRERMSVNAWLVRAVSSMLEFENRAAPAERRASRSGQRYNGWVT